MTDQAREALQALIDELRKGAAGPCDYWYRQLAERLSDRIRAPRVLPTAKEMRGILK